MLPDHLMRELRYIEVYTAKKLRNVRSGTFTSRVRGSGFDFDEHRPYRPGDDVRRIDWNVTARLNEPFMRLTHAEREMNLLIALDLSPSMRFGTARYSKKEITLIIAACLVFSAIADQVNTGFVTFSDRVVSYHKPRRTRARAWATLEELWRLDFPPSRTRIEPVAQFLASRLNTASTVVIVSDFLTDERLSESRDMKVLATKHDVIGVVIEDPTESQLPEGTNVIHVRDLETGRPARIGLNARVRRQYQESVAQHRADRVRDFYRVPMDHVFVRGDGNVTEPLLRLFESRRRT